MARKQRRRSPPVRSRSRERSTSTLPRRFVSRSPSGSHASVRQSPSRSPAASPWRGSRLQGRRFALPFDRFSPVLNDLRNRRSRVRRSPGLAQGRRSPVRGDSWSPRRPSRGPSTLSSGVDAMRLWKKAFVVWRILSLVVPGKSLFDISFGKLSSIGGISSTPEAETKRATENAHPYLFRFIF